MIKFESEGDFRNSFRFLRFLQRKQFLRNLEHYAQIGVEALRNATPVDSGETAMSWTYEIVESKGRISIHWFNTKTTNEGTPIAILIQYGHATKNGRYIQGLDFINPALKPIFEQIYDDIWREVTNA